MREREMVVLKPSHHAASAEEDDTLGIDPPCHHSCHHHTLHIIRGDVRLVSVTVSMPRTAVVDCLMANPTGGQDWHFSHNQLPSVKEREKAKIGVARTRGGQCRLECGSCVLSCG